MKSHFEAELKNVEAELKNFKNNLAFEEYELSKLILLLSGIKNKLVKNFSVCDSKKRGIAHYAAAMVGNNNEEGVRLLQSFIVSGKELGFDVFDEVDEDDFNVLHVAAQKGNLGAIYLLYLTDPISFKKAAEFKTTDNKTPVELAEIEGKEDAAIMISGLIKSIQLKESAEDKTDSNESNRTTIRK